MGKKGPPPVDVPNLGLFTVYWTSFMRALGQIIFQLLIFQKILCVFSIVNLTIFGHQMQFMDPDPSFT